MKADFLQACSLLLYDARFAVEGDHIVKLIFDEMTTEAVAYYPQLFRMLPIELVNPSVLLAYLPPGKAK